VINSSMKMQR